MSKSLGAAILVSAIVALTLTGCASGRTPEERVESNATAFTITTPSGRVVECIEYNGGLSCDWERAQ
jgi:outer membrane lipoprotein SlyB